MNPLNSPADPPAPPDPPMVKDTQWPNKPCHPLAIHDKFPPVGANLLPPTSSPKR